jgi:predicted aspartyl protease
MPIVDIRAEGFPDPISVLVDTGFNGELIISEEPARGAGILYLQGHVYPAMVANAWISTCYPAKRHKNPGRR